MKSIQSRPALIFLAILVVYSALLLPTLARQGISWDEQTDQNITLAYLQRPDGWLAGSNIDLSQTRLPMFTVGLAYTLFGTTNLVVARAMSALAGALTLLGVFLYARKRFGDGAALLACALLATSPFFLSFARVAYTETDIYLACALIWLLIGLDRFAEQPNVGRAALVGVLLGLTLSAKFTALAFFPVAWYALYRLHQPQPARQSSPSTKAMVAWTVWLAVLIVAGWYAANYTPPEQRTPAFRLGLYLVALAGWLAPLLWAARSRSNTAAIPALGGFITALSLLTFFILPPEHLTNPGILRALLWRVDHEMALNPAFIYEAGALHLLSIFFKSSPIIGAGLLAGTVAAFWQWRRPEVRPMLIAILLYFGGLIILPIAQTFYVIPLLPLLAILAADRFISLMRHRRRPALALAVLAALGLSIDLALCYPDYNLNGYQYLGIRPLALRSSIGYRSVAQTTSDGVQQAVEWLNQNAGANDRVLAYLNEWHIVEAGTIGADYTIRPGFDAPLFPPPDYIVLHINAIVRQGWGNDNPTGELVLYPIDKTWLTQNYQQVFSVPRRFGIEMASVWQRNGPDEGTDNR